MLPVLLSEKKDKVEGVFILNNVLGTVGFIEMDFLLIYIAVLLEPIYKQ